MESDGTLDRYRKEQTEFDAYVHYGANDPDKHWPESKLLDGYAAVDEARQMDNPIAVLTSGEEQAASKTYPAGGKFRFVDRVAWWNHYQDEQAVVIGHYLEAFPIFEIVRGQALLESTFLKAPVRTNGLGPGRKCSVWTSPWVGVEKPFPATFAALRPSVGPRQR